MANETKFKVHEGPHELHGYYFEGIAAHFNHDGNEVIMISPTSQELAHFFSRACSGVLNPANCKMGYFGSASKLIELDKPVDLKEEGVKPKYTYPMGTLLWYIHPESYRCFLEYGGYVSGDGMSQEIGIAEKQTVIECKLILRNLGWNRADIDKLNISDEEPVPF